jgi:hypothetical protein
VFHNLYEETVVQDRLFSNFELVLDGLGTYPGKTSGPTGGLFAQTPGKSLISNTVKGLFTGSKKGLTSFEIKRIDELLDEGYNIERIVEDNINKVADIKVNGMVTELKALTANKLNVNTAITRLQEGLKKTGVQVVELDIREPGGTLKDAQAIYDSFKRIETSKGNDIKQQIRIIASDGTKTF